jgi:hypothetical protein
MSRGLYDNLIFERQKNLPESSPGTRVGIIGIMQNCRCGHDYTMMFQRGHFRKLIRKADVHNIFSGEKFVFPDSLPKGGSAEVWNCGTVEVRNYGTMEVWNCAKPT